MNANVTYQVNRPDVIDERFDDEFVLVNLRDGTYYGVNSTGTLLWEQIVEGASPTQMIASLSKHFAAEPAVIANAVQAFLDDLAQESLIIAHENSTVTTSPVSARPDVSPHANLQVDLQAPFVLPAFEKFTDMQQVLQLDPIHEVDDSGWPARKP